MIDTDTLIVGGGITGACLALALAPAAKVTVIESGAYAPHPTDHASHTLALSISSVHILKALGIWEQLVPHLAKIETVHVSEVGRFGKVIFSAKDHGTVALGYTLPVHALQQALQKAIRHHPHITIYELSKPVALQPYPGGYRVQVQTKSACFTFNTPLLVGADGTHSQTRQLLKIQWVSYSDSLAHTALTAHITGSDKNKHPHVAYQRVTPQGILAVLPKKGAHNGLVFTTKTEDAKQLQMLSDSAQLALFQTYLGQRLGKLTTIVHKNTYPLTHAHARVQVMPHAVLLGNAAHTLSPIAAQGLNLSLKDMAILAQMCLDTIRESGDLGNASMLLQYVAKRKSEQRQVIGLTKTLLRAFSNTRAPAGPARSLAFLLLEGLPLKNYMAKMTSGLGVSLPLWVRAQVSLNR